jgi:hypothetical protein
MDIIKGRMRNIKSCIDKKGGNIKRIKKEKSESKKKRFFCK